MDYSKATLVPCKMCQLKNLICITSILCEPIAITEVQITLPKRQNLGIVASAIASKNNTL